MLTAKQIEQNYLTIKQQIEQAATLAKRPLSTVELMVVTKTHGEEDIVPLLLQGHRLFGENRVQEAREKWPALKKTYPNVNLHLIGPLQTNKIKEAVELFDMIETVDREKLAIALAKEMHKQQRNRPCLIQINTGEEPQKAGIRPSEADRFIEYCQHDLKIQISGLMCIPPVGDSPAPHFNQLSEIASRHQLPMLSMGMSSDYTIAIRYGATIVRVGSAILGSR